MKNQMYDNQFQNGLYHTQLAGLRVVDILMLALDASSSQSTRYRRKKIPMKAALYIPRLKPHQSPATPIFEAKVNAAPIGIANSQNPKMFNSNTSFCLPNPRMAPPVFAWKASPSINMQERGINLEIKLATSSSLLKTVPRTLLQGSRIMINTT
mmetsp:Transcript_15756/g.23494  ORF Transcript_15756/g.23494 Transcript_15756/m.23494 type:complete len:154 (-) Transcript_15756:333-794(-)